MSKVYNQEVILYRLDAIERRLENVEKHMMGMAGAPTEKSDLVHVLIDLIKNGNAPAGAQAAAVGAPAPAADASEATTTTPKNFDNLAACIARRRTIV